MLIWKDFTTDFVQTTAFVQNQDFATARAIGAILAAFGDRFDGEMQVLPLSPEVPPEIPRVILQSSDKHWRLSMAPTRLDSAWINKPETSPVKFDEILFKCAEVLKHYVGQNKVAVIRLALVVHRICPTDKPAETLISWFCNEKSQREPFKRSESFEIHNHKVYTAKHDQEHWQINSWVRCKSAKLLANDHPVVLVEQDLNTLINDPPAWDYNAEQTYAFFRMAAAEADEILRVYFSI